jgi:tetratricopeptide (TPR) repeat protein
MNEPAPCDELGREETIFNAAVQLGDAAKRAIYLDLACENDPALRARIEKLLASDAGDNFFAQPLAKPVYSNPTGATPAAPAPAGPEAQAHGERIGRYRLLQKIGEGGLGLVYMAEQEEPVRRRVALKVIRLGMDTQSVVARFEAERQALAMMDHPNIAKILDGGVTETGRPYFVMDLVQGLPITQFCDEAKLSTPARLELFREVCSAVQHAHQKGIIHRDLKPSNILVTLHGDKPVPKVIDFGIAKATQQRLTDKTLFTQFQQFMGTPAYVSPEQATLSGLDIDTRSDIYSLGVLLYELLTGKTPFDSKELLKAGLDEMRRTICEKEPPTPSTRVSTMHGDELTTTAQRRGIEPPKLISTLRGDLDWIVMKCLEKDRARRYETANGVATDIQRHLNNEPVVAGPPGKLYRLRKLVRRNRGVFGATAAICAALVLGVFASTWEAVRARKAEQEQTNLRLQAQAQNRFLRDIFAGVGPSRALGRDTAMLKEMLDQTAERVGKELTNQPQVEIEVHDILADTYDELGLYPQMEAMAQRELTLARAQYGEEHLAVARALNWLGVAQWELGRYAQAETTHTKALGIRRKLLGQQHLDVAVSIDNLAKALRDLHREHEAEQLYREALEMRRKLLGNENIAVASSINNLANSLFYQAKYTQAEGLYRQALAMRQKLLGSEHPDVAGSLNNLAGALKMQNKPDEAAQIYRQALELRRKLLPNDHPKLAEAMVNLANVLPKRENAAEVEELLRKALAIQAKQLGTQHPKSMAITFRSLVELLMNQGRATEVEQLFAQVGAGSGAQIQSAPLLRVRGDWYARRGRFAEAMSDFRRATQIDPADHECWGLLGSTLVQAGDVGAYCDHCRKMVERFGAAGDPPTGGWWTLMTCILLPCPETDRAAMDHLREVTSHIDPNDWAWFWAKLQWGILAYRQGRFETAVEWIQKALPGAQDTYVPGDLTRDSRGDVSAYMALAMANYRLNRTNEAYFALARGLKIFENRLPKVESGDVGEYWERWVMAQVLQKEATALMGKPTDLTSLQRSQP